MCALLLAQGLAVLADLSGALADEGLPGIVSPSQASPARASPGGVLDVLVRLRLPLTPPPGVQQPASLEGWRASLTRNDAFAPGGQAGIMVYRIGIIRLRPWSGDVYRLTTELLPWLPPGRYGLEVTGPGFSGRQAKAVIVGLAEDSKAPAELEVRRAGDRALEAYNRDAVGTLWSFDFIVPAGTPGVALKAGGKRLSPKGVAWATAPLQGETGARVLSFQVEVGGAGEDGPGRKRVEWSPVPAAPCDVRIAWPEARSPEEPMAWRDLELISAGARPAAVIWSFGGGKWGVGARVRHRWLVEEEAAVTATAFDHLGRACTARANLNLKLASDGAGCSCGATPGRTTRGPHPMFFLFSGAIGE